MRSRWFYKPKRLGSLLELNETGGIRCSEKVVEILQSLHLMQTLSMRFRFIKGMAELSRKLLAQNYLKLPIRR